MAYYFKRKESVAKAIRRLSHERVDHALECLKQSDRAEAVHCARKDIKKGRAVLRLVRARIAKKDFRRLTVGLREAAMRLAPARDAYIKVQTLRNLARHFTGQLARGALRHTRTELRNDYEEEMKRFGKEKTASAVGKALRREMNALRRLKVKGKGWRALSPGVKAAYRRGRHAYQTVVKSPSPENFHEWRKRVKDLWYHARLLQPMWPEQMDAMAGELQTLGDALGDDHDLVVLRQDVGDRPIDSVNPRELETLSGLIEQRQRELRGEALALGARFYAEKPSAFCNRLAEYWQSWRRGKKSLTPSAGVTV